MRISTKRVEEIVETCHPGGTYKAMRITEYATLATDLLDARHRIEELERDAEAALSTLRDQARMREERESWRT